MNRKFKYYTWCLKYWCAENLYGTILESILDRVLYFFTGKNISFDLPNGHYPMKYNLRTKEFDQFYTWREILFIDDYFKNTDKI